MTTDIPEPLYQSNAAVLMSQPLKSSPASMLSSRYRAGAPSPAERNSTRMSRPIDDDGTESCSTGGLENAAAVGDARKHMSTATTADTVTRRTEPPRPFSTKAMLPPLGHAPG